MFGSACKKSPRWSDQTGNGQTQRRKSLAAKLASDGKQGLKCPFESGPWNVTPESGRFCPNQQLGCPAHWQISHIMQGPFSITRSGVQKWAFLEKKSSFLPEKLRLAFTKCGFFEGHQAAKNERWRNSRRNLFSPTTDACPLLQRTKKNSSPGPSERDPL